MTERKPGLIKRILRHSEKKWMKAAADCITIDELLEQMKHRIPSVVTDYFLGAAGDEQTARENVAAYEKTRFNPFYGNKFSTVDLSTTVLGHKIDLPVIASPVGSLRTLWPHGEAVAAKAVGKAGTICILSTLTGTSLEEVKAATTGPAWFQLYLVGGKEVALKSINRAKKAGYSALVLTIDTPVAGIRLRDERNGSKTLLHGSVWQKAKYTPLMMRHLSWLKSFYADGGLMEFPNIELPGGKPMPYTDIGRQLQESAVTWEDLEWIKEAWGGPIVIKGVHNVHDAKQAEKYGASAIVISNHGGRQLNRVLPTLHILREVAPAMKGSSVEILVDGGIRSGADVAIALAAGAKAALIGRTYAFGLGAGGEAGVSRAFTILKNELEHTMRQLGCGSVDQINPSHIARESFSL